MRFKSLTSQDVLIIDKKKIYCYEKSDSYLSELLDKYDLLDNIVAIIDDFKRNQGVFCLNGKQIDIVGTEYLENVDFSDATILITSDYYKEAFDKLSSISNVSNSLDVIYFYANRETEIELEYREKYENRELENIIVFRSGPHASSYVPGMDFSDNARALFEYMLSEKYNERRGGMYRNGSVDLLGTHVNVPSSYMVPQIMDNISWRILEMLKKTLDNDVSNSEYIDEINSCIYEMIRTQPFQDGNKRTSRLLSNILYQEKGLPYVLLPVKEWDNYVDAWSDNNIDSYNQMMHRLILESYDYFYGGQSVGNVLKGKVEGTKLINANRK